MTKPPPYLPEETLERVIRVAAGHGRGLLMLLGGLALLFALNGDSVGALCACVVAGAGGMQLHGAQLLGLRDFRGHSCLFRSQVLFLGAAFAFCFLRFQQFDLAAALSEIPPEMMKSLEEAKIDPAALARGTNWFFNCFLATLALIYSTVLMRFYAKRRASILTALSD